MDLFALRGRANDPVGLCWTCGSLLAALGAAAASAQRADPGPRIVFSTTRGDLGRVDAGGSARLTFPFRNSGARPLRILAVEGDCGCITPEYPKTVAPGKSAVLTALFEAQPGWGGKIERSLRVRTDDPVQPEVKLSVVVDIVPFVQMDPCSPLQLFYRPGQVYRKTVRLTPRAGSKLGLSNPSTNSPLIKARLDPPAAGDSKRAYTLHLTIGPRAQPGDFSATVKVQTTEPSYSEAWLAVTGLAEIGPVVNPSEISLPTVRPGPEGQEVARLQVFTRRGRLKLLSVNTGTPALRAERVEKTPGYFYEVSLRTTALWKSGVIASTIQVRTDDPKTPVVKVPFHATAQ